jgi:acyl dehydratase
MTTTFESLNAGDSIEGPKFAVSRESIRLFCDASLDYNPLHLDDDYMKGNFGKTNFGGIIMHGMNNFGGPFIAASRPAGSSRSGPATPSSPPAS